MINRIEPDEEGHNNWNDSNDEKVFEWLSHNRCLIWIILVIAGVIN